jgi:hypothetical protein
MKPETKHWSPVAIVLQGPLSFNTLLTLYKYREEHEITVVAPSQDETKSIAEEIIKMTDEKQYHISFFSYDLKIHKEQNNHQNRFFHFYSTEIGIRNVSKNYVIKIRNDEFYSNLKPFFETILKFPDKIITGDVFFRKQKSYPYHPSDHLVGGEKEIMLQGFSLATRICENSTLMNDHPIFEFSKINLEDLAAEQLLGLSFIASTHTKHTLDDPISVMKRTFEIVPTEMLGTFNIKQNHRNENYTTLRYFEKEKDIKDMNDYGKDDVL